MSEGRLTLRDRRTLAWREYGPSDGRPVLWFQGTPGSRYSRHADESAYDRLHVRLIVFDRPGFGASTRLPGRGISAVADDAAELLDELGLASVRVGGGSGGGAHVLALAAGHPERVLAATVIAGGSPFEEERDLDALIELNRDAWYAAQQGWEALYSFSAPVRERILADPLAGFRAVMDDAPASDKAVIDDPAWQRIIIESMTEALRPGAEGWVDEQLALLPPWDFDPTAVRCSLTWWHGEHDANTPLAAVRRLVDRMAGVDLRVWTDAGHLEFFHRYEAILEELLAR